MIQKVMGEVVMLSVLTHEVLKRAAELAPSAAEWIRRDEFGSWERTARAALSGPISVDARAAQVSEKDLVESVALAIAEAALTALINEAKKKEQGNGSTEEESAAGN